jgi:signal transduction histidine kinase
MSTPVSREAAFIGKIMAGATHEIRNVLAIVKESAGLIDDLMQASITRGPLDGDRVFRATQRIEAQVARGAEIVTSLNGLAHSMDLECRAIDLPEEIRQVVFLSQRFARRKSQTLAALPGDARSAFTGNSLAVQMALFAVLELCMEELPEGATVEMWTGAADGRARVEVGATLNGAAIRMPTAGPAWERTRDLVRDVGATLRPTERGNGLQLVFESEG